MNTEEFKVEVLKIFKTEKTLLITADGHVFKTTNKAFCKSHCERNELKFEELTQDEFLKKFDSDKASKTTSEVDFLALDKLSNPELKKLAASLGVKSASQKSADLIEALQAYKDALDDSKQEPKKELQEGEEGYVPVASSEESAEGKANQNPE